jgi:subtilisin family serine protease
MIVTAVVFFGIPFLYNSCQQFQGARGTLNNLVGSNNTCRFMLEHGRLQAVKSDPATSPFSSRKAILSDQTITPGSHLKTVDPTIVKKGTKLSVILDNNCVRATYPKSAFLKAIIGQLEPHPEFPSQAYDYTLPTDQTADEIEALSQQEKCVTGLSFNRTYRAQTVGMSFNDPDASAQPHLSAIEANLAYGLFYATPNGMPESGGTPVKIAVIDTGIDYTHPDLQANIAQNASGWGIDITTLGGNVSYNPMDVSPIGHGTHVSGLIAAVSNNGIGVVGTMPFNANVMAVKIFASDGAGGVTTTTTYFYNGILFAILNHADVINLSVEASGTDYDSVAQSGLQQAVNAGIPVAVAMGNGNPAGQLVDGITVHVVPAVYSTIHGVIGVASIDADTGYLSNFSNYGTTYAEIGAPGASSAGVGITSTIPMSLNSYGQLSGTSQATPMVSAAAALTVGWIKKAYNGQIPSPAEVETLILGSADVFTPLTNYVQGARKLDLYSLANVIMSNYPNTAATGSGSTTLPPPSGVVCN